MRKKIIATGISGLVGSRIVELLKEKFDFINFSLDEDVDITNYDLLKNKFIKHLDADIVLHLAAFTDVDAAWKQNEDKNGSCYKVNVLGSKNIAQLCKRYDKYLISISTDFVFNGLNTSLEGYTEQSQTDPVEWYGKTKYYSELKINDSKCNYSIFRIAFPFKATFSNENLEPVKKIDLVRRIIQKLESNQIINMFSDQIITPTFIDDIVKALTKAIIKKPQGIFHCVGSTSLSPYKLALKTAKTFNLNSSLIVKSSLKEFIKNNPSGRPRQINLSLSNQKLQKELGIKMSTIDEALEIMKKQQSLQ